MKKDLTEALLTRLPSYLQALVDFKSNGFEFISSNDLAEHLDLNHELVRKDIALLSSKKGIPNKGRNIDELIEDIQILVGNGRKNNALLVGVGSLGKALLNYDGFERYGLNIVAAFDTNLDIVGKQINGIPVYQFDELRDVKRRFNASIGIICVPKGVAQSVAIKLVAVGIDAIWNFAPVKLDLSDNIIVSDMDMAESLAKLAHHLFIKVSQKGE